MTIETIHQEFERMGESAVEELFVRQSCDNLKRIYAVRWLGKAAFDRLEADAARRQVAEEEHLRARRTMRITAEALMLVSGAVAIGMFLLRMAMFH